MIEVQNSLKLNGEVYYRVSICWLPEEIALASYHDQ